MQYMTENQKKLVVNQWNRLQLREIHATFEEFCESRTLDPGEVSKWLEDPWLNVEIREREWGTRLPAEHMKRLAREKQQEEARKQKEKEEKEEQEEWEGFVEVGARRFVKAKPRPDITKDFDVVVHTRNYKVGFTNGFTTKDIGIIFDILEQRERHCS